MVTMQGRVDPRPVKPPALGLLASANKVVTGGDPVPAQMKDGVEIVPASDGTEANWVTNADGSHVHWINGFAYIPEECNGGDIIAKDSGAPGTPPNLWADSDFVAVTPYIVEGIDKRSTAGTPSDGNYAESKAYARRQLLACESKQIAHELWTGKLTSGVATGNRHLTSNDVVILEGDRAVGWLTALAALEREIKTRTCGAQAMIHARADTVAIWDAGGALRRVGDLILTIHDTIVVADAGYPGTAPDTGAVGLDPNHAGVTPSSDSAWAYATSIIDVYRSAFFNEQPMTERLERSTNTLLTYERRAAAATWGCLHVGIHVDHINQISTTGS